jgi:hypothetical protein
MKLKKIIFESEDIDEAFFKKAAEKIKGMFGGSKEDKKTKYDVRRTNPNSEFGPGIAIFNGDKIHRDDGGPALKTENGDLYWIENGHIFWSKIPARIPYTDLMKSPHIWGSPNVVDVARPSILRADGTMEFVSNTGNFASLSPDGTFEIKHRNIYDPSASGKTALKVDYNKIKKLFKLKSPSEYYKDFESVEPTTQSGGVYR